ncbi:MAG: sulfite exporter TauE/SafE family protein [Hyphomonadaceae bacterium]|nr:sulfite exporter TauE/SafE family protein [Hyphomonadaceae bacterium]
MRGITGFGGAMLMTPPLGILLGPVPAVVISLGLEAIAALIMVPAVHKDLPLRQFSLLIVPACLAIPVGTQVLVGVDAVLARRMIGAMVVISSLAMLTGLRYAREAPSSMSVAIGSLAGVLLGATGIGAPPVVLFLLSGPSPIQNTRAILTVFISATSLIGFISLYMSGAVTTRLVAGTAALAACYLGTTWLGMKAFTRLTDRGVRTIALCMMLAMGGTALLI